MEAQLFCVYIWRLRLLPIAVMSKRTIDGVEKKRVRLPSIPEAVCSAGDFVCEISGYVLRNRKINAAEIRNAVANMAMFREFSVGESVDTLAAETITLRDAVHAHAKNLSVTGKIRVLFDLVAFATQ